MPETVKLQLLLRREWRNSEGINHAKRLMPTLGLHITAAGAATISAETGLADFESIFGVPVEKIAPRPPGARDFGSPGGYAAGDLPVPEVLQPYVEIISVAPPTQGWIRRENVVVQNSSERISMNAFDAKLSARDKKFTSPSEELRIAVTFRGPDGIGPTSFPAPLSTDTISRLMPDPPQVDRALYELSRLGFKVTSRGRITASVRGSRALFEKTFGTRLAPLKMDPKQDYAFYSFYYPPEGAPWNPPAAPKELIDDAYIQCPHIYMARDRRVRVSKRVPRKRVAIEANGQAPTPSATPPQVGYFHLEMPVDVPRLLNPSKSAILSTLRGRIRPLCLDRLSLSNTRLR
jgi:hypothetical protein